MFPSIRVRFVEISMQYCPLFILSLALRCLTLLPSLLCNSLFHYDESERLRHLSTSRWDENPSSQTERNPNPAKFSGPIFECNSACTCTISCGNRVVQRGIKCLLEVRSTVHRGWGVFSREPLPSGRFVGEVRGSILYCAQS